MTDEPMANRKPDFMKSKTKLIWAILSPALFVLLAQGIWSACSSENNIKGEARPPLRHMDLPYVDNGTTRQVLDLYVPDKPGKNRFPVIVWIHGGSWMYGDKKEGCIPCEFLTDQFAVASINYTFTTEAPLPAQINDCKAAVRFLKASAGKYRLDPDRIGVWGSSAGGYLACILGTTGNVKWMDGNIGDTKHTSKVHAVCDWSGPVNFFSAQSQVGPDNKFKYEGQGSAIYSLMGTNMHPMALLSASPINYIQADAPPFLIMHGDKDDAVPLAQSKELYHALKARSVPAELIIVKDGSHDLNSPENIKIVRKFFQKTLAPTNSP